MLGLSKLKVAQERGKGKEGKEEKQEGQQIMHTFVHYIKDTTYVTGSFSTLFAYNPLSTGKAMH